MDEKVTGKSSQWLIPEAILLNKAKSNGVAEPWELLSEYPGDD